jgi:polysaccharide deacetylase family protein (PEP-CTERM system associated)
MGPRCAMTIDVEDWFHVENLRPAIARDTWDDRQLRVEANTDRMLGLLDEAGVSATFFVLGWVAERCPRLVRDIADAGHEVASHGYGHELVTRLSPEAFADDVGRARTLLQDLSGQPIDGYRAPCFSITDWALPILQRVGHAYDSSHQPVAGHDRYGVLPGVEADRTLTEALPGFHEAAVATLPMGRRRLPWGGGGWFRLLPYGLYVRGLRRRLAAWQPVVFYLHPWEIDAAQPRLGRRDGVRRLHAFRHYHALDRTADKWARLLKDLPWGRLDDLLAEHAASPTSTTNALRSAA